MSIPYIPLVVIENEKFCIPNKNRILRDYMENKIKEETTEMFKKEREEL